MPSAIPPPTARVEQLGLRRRRRVLNPLCWVLYRRIGQLGITEEELHVWVDPPRTPPVNPKPPCVVRGCQDEQTARCLCKRHYGQWDYHVGISGRGVLRDPRRAPKGTSVTRAEQDLIIELYRDKFMSGRAVVEELCAQGFPRTTISNVYRLLRLNGVRVRRRWWKPSHHLPQVEVATIIWLYEDCRWSVGRIAEWRGCSPSTISMHLKYNGAKMRGRSPYEDMREEWTKLHDGGTTFAAIAAQYGVNSATVQRQVNGRQRTEYERQRDRERGYRRYHERRAAGRRGT